MTFNTEDFIKASEAKAIAAPAYPVRVQNFIEEIHKAITEAASGGLKNIDLRIPTDIADPVLKVIYAAGYQSMSRAEPSMGMSFFRVSWN